MSNQRAVARRGGGGEERTVARRGGDKSMVWYINRWNNHLSDLREMVRATWDGHLLVFTNFVSCQFDFSREDFVAILAWKMHRCLPLRVE